MPKRLYLMGLPLDSVDLAESLNTLQDWLNGPTKTVITLNPEIIVQSNDDSLLRQAIRHANLVTADGIGIVWAAKKLLNQELPGRVTGVDLTTNLMQTFPDIRVYFLGAKPGIAEKAALNCQNQYGIQIAGTQDGYFLDKQSEDIVQKIKNSGAQLLLTALGAGRQECFNERFRDELGVGIAIGVGGTLDVLAGEVKRAPEILNRFGLEWAWRIATMRRFGRAKRLWTFINWVLSNKKLPD